MLLAATDLWQHLNNGSNYVVSLFVPSLLNMENFKEYVAVYAFRNEADSLLDLTVNDIIEVPFGSSQQNVDVPGWVKGRNKRTGIEGYFPGNTDLLLCHLKVIWLHAFCSPAVSYLSQLDRKTESQPSGVYMATRMQGSPVKSQLLNRLEDYNDSGYGGSPLPPGKDWSPSVG